MSIAKVSWESHPASKHNVAGVSNPGGAGELVGFVTSHMGEPAGCVVTDEGRIVVVRLDELKFEGWPE